MVKEKHTQMDDKKKYPGLNENDTHWDDYHRKNGMMTNAEFFTSNAKGGFYEGTVWNKESGEWVPDQASREREQRIQESNKCSECGGQKPYCECW